MGWAERGALIAPLLAAKATLQAEDAPLRPLRESRRDNLAHTFSSAPKDVINFLPKWDEGSLTHQLHDEALFAQRGRHRYNRMESLHARALIGQPRAWPPLIGPIRAAT